MKKTIMVFKATEKEIEEFHTNDVIVDKDVIFSSDSMDHIEELNEVDEVVSLTEDEYYEYLAWTINDKEEEEHYLGIDY
ncbi:MAG: hypothetical protein ACRC5T_05075 [Cetobacterium sp.]